MMAVMTSRPVDQSRCQSPPSGEPLVGLPSQKVWSAAPHRRWIQRRRKHRQSKAKTPAPDLSGSGSLGIHWPKSIQDIGQKSMVVISTTKKMTPTQGKMNENDDHVQLGNSSHTHHNCLANVSDHSNQQKK